MKLLQKTQITLPCDLHRAAKIRSFEEGVTLNALINKALRTFLRFKESGKSAKGRAK